MKEGQKFGKFWFSGNMPDEVVESCKDDLLDFAILIPDWCKEVRVYWDVNGDENLHTGGPSAAYIETSYPYRTASLYICPSFLLEEEDERTKTLLHELCHVITNPLLDYVKDSVAIIAKDDTVSELVTREAYGRAEAVTEDLTNILLKVFNNNE